MEWNTGSALGIVQARALVHKYCVTSLFSVGMKYQVLRLSAEPRRARSCKCDSGMPLPSFRALRFYGVGIYSKLQNVPCWLVLSITHIVTEKVWFTWTPDIVI